MGYNSVDRDRMVLTGEVVDSNKGLFTVQINEGYKVLCTLAGKIKQNEIKVLVGDIAEIEVSPYDTLRGRIVKRIRE